MKNMHRTLFGTLILLAALSAAPAAFADAVWEDFEQGSTYWSAIGLANLQVSDVGLSPDYPSEGKSCLRARFTAGTVGNRMYFVTFQIGDMQGLTALTADVFNASEVPFKAMMVFKQGERYQWYETTRLDVKPGWNKGMRFAVNPAKETPGEAVMKIPVLKDIREAALYFDCQAKGEGNLYLDNIRLEGIDPGHVLRTSSLDVPQGEEVLVAGFEATNPFTPDSAWSDAVAAESMPVTDATQGQGAGRFSYKMKSPDNKAAFNFEADMNLTKVNGIRFDVYNPTKESLDVAIAVNTGPKWSYYESPMKPLKPGWNRDLTFSLKSSTFKCDASGWRSSAEVKALNQTRKFLLSFMPHSIGEGYVLVDNVRFITQEAKSVRKMLTRIVPPDVPLTGEDRMLEGFEKDPVKFTANTAWSAATASEPTTQASEGKRGLKCDFDIPADKSASYGVEMDMDLSKAQAVKVDVFLPEEYPLQAYLAFNTGSTFEWWESKPQALKKGWNRDITFTLAGPVFKSQRTNWQFSSPPRNLKQTKKVYIGFFTNKALKGFVVMDNVRVTGVPEAALSGSVRTRQLNGRTVVWDPLETASRGWRPSTSAADNSFSTVVYYEKMEGERVVKLKYRTQADSQQARFYKEEQLDWTSVLAVKMDVYNPQEQPVNMAMAFQTGPEFTWHESKEMTVAPGWNRDITVDLASPQFKTARSNWSNTDYLNRKDDIRSVSLLFYPKAGEGSIALSNLRTLERDPLGALGMPGAGKVVGASSKTTISSRFIKYDLVESFENGVSDWQAINKTALSPSGEYVTDSDRSLKVEYDTAGGDSPEILWKVPAVYRNLSPYERIQFDVYNAGPALEASVAFKSTSDDVWIEGASIPLSPGWNRNVTVNLSGNQFKSARTAWIMGESFRNKGHVDEVHIKLNPPAGRSALYFDRVQMGRETAGTQSDLTGQQTLQLKINPTDAAQLKLEGDVWKTDSGPAIGQLSKARLDLRGYGNEISVSTGESLVGTDDLMEILNGSRLGPGIFGATERFYAFNTSVQLVGFSDYGDKPHTFGSQAGYAARLSHVMDEDYVLGSGVVAHRLGMAPGSNPLSSEVEADVKTAEFDAKGYFRPLNLAFGGEVARSFYDSWDGGPFDVKTGMKDGYQYFSTIFVGKFKFSGGRRDLGAKFFAPCSLNPYPGGIQNNFEASWQAETFSLVDSLRNRSFFLSDLFDDFNIFTQYYDWYSRSDSYSNWGVRLVARNNDTSRLHYFMWWYWFKEGKDAGDLTLTNPLLSTRLLTTTVNPELQYRLTENLFARYHFRFGYTDYWEELSHAGGLSCKFWGNTWLSGDGRYTRKSGSRTGEFVNWSGELTKSLVEDTVEARVSYGLPSFVNYWKDENSLKTVNQWAFSLGAKF